MILSKEEIEDIKKYYGTMPNVSRLIESHEELMGEFNITKATIRVADGHISLLQEENARLKAKLQDAREHLEMALGAFEHNHAIDWNDIERCLERIKNGR